MKLRPNSDRPPPRRVTESFQSLHILRIWVHVILLYLHNCTQYTIWVVYYGGGGGGCGEGEKDGK